MDARRLLGRITPLTWVLAALCLLALAAYVAYPGPLYLFHKMFLNKLTPGLSLVKPLLFFALLFGSSAVRDLFPVAKPRLRTWAVCMAGVLVGLLALTVIGFIVFAGNLQKSNDALNQSVPVTNGGIFYLSYEAHTMFFFTISTTTHVHENKALVYPVAQHLGLKGDVGEAVYPFYPLPWLLLAAALLLAVGLLFLQSLRLLSVPDRRVQALLTVYMAVLFWRMLHAAFDGGLFNAHLLMSVALFVFGTLLYAYARQPTSAKALSHVCIGIIATPIVLKIVLVAVFAALGIRIDLGVNTVVLLVAEQLLLLAAVTLLLGRERPSAAIARNHRGVALGFLLTLAVLTFFIQGFLAQEVRTALDPSDSYFARRSPDHRYLVSTALQDDDPCNVPPAKEFQINGAHVLVYRLTKNLSCTNDLSHYWYPIEEEVKVRPQLIVACEGVSIPVQRSGDACFVTLEKTYPLFRFSVAQDLPGERVYFTFRTGSPAPGSGQRRQ